MNRLLPPSCRQNKKQKTKTKTKTKILYKSIRTLSYIQSCIRSWYRCNNLPVMASVVYRVARIQTPQEKSPPDHRSSLFTLRTGRFVIAVICI